MNIPNTPSMQRARKLYTEFTATLNANQKYSMQEFNSLMSAFVADHNISELDHDNMLEIKYDHMLIDGDNKMPTHSSH